MGLERLYATMFTRDLGVAEGFYATLFARPADHRPMDGLVEWEIGASGGLQLCEAAERAGTGSVTLIIKDLDADTKRLADAGLSIGEIGAFDTARLLQPKDADGNDVVLAEPFAAQ